MAGHSKWANIKHRKAAQDKKRSGQYTKLAREIIVAAKSGADISFNPRLRVAVAAAKSVGMPKDRIEYAIKKGSGELSEGEQYDEVRYEGYAPGGVALIIECLTDNRNRTAGELRTALNKAGGTLGESGSVAFQFNRIGLIHYPASAASADAMFEAALEAGADDVESDENTHAISCAMDSLNEVREALMARFGDPESAKLDWKATITVPVTGNDAAEGLFKLLDTLEDLDDVQSVSSNADFSEELMQRMAG